MEGNILSFFLGNVNKKNDSFREIKNKINASELDEHIKDILISYINEIENGKRDNDFFDIDLLLLFINKIINQKLVFSSIDEFNQIIVTEKRELLYFLPYGKETQNFEQIKSLIISNEGFLNRKLYALFNDKSYYQQIMSEINLSNLPTIAIDYIFKYAVDVAPFLVNQDAIKLSVLSFIEKCKNEISDDYEKLYIHELEEIKKSNGIYSFDEKTIADLSQKANFIKQSISSIMNLMEQVEIQEKRVNQMIDSGLKSIDDSSNSALENIKSEIKLAKNSITSELTEYQELLQKTLKSSSDNAFNILLGEMDNKIKKISSYVDLVTTTANSDLARVKTAADQSVSELTNFLKNEPQIREILKNLVANNEKHSVNVTQTPHIVVSQASQIAVPQASHIVTPQAPQIVVPQTSIDIIPAFDSTISFASRFEKIMEEKDRRIANGEYFHKKIDEVIECIIEGDWPYLWGPSGCGKSTMVGQAAELIGIDLEKNEKITHKFDITAYNNAQGQFCPTLTYISVVEGKLLFLDEFDNGNPDDQIVLNGIYSTSLDAIEHPDKKYFLNFADITKAQINPNFRMISAGNTQGNGGNEFYSSRNKIDESVLSRMTPLYIDYDNNVEKRIFNSYKEWYEFFCQYRKVCDDYAKRNSLSCISGMVTTRDAKTIVKNIKNDSKSISEVISQRFINSKDLELLRFLKKYIIENCNYESVSDSDLNESLEKYTLDQINGVFVDEVNKIMKLKL